MFKNFITKIKKFYNIKFFFNFPSQKNILLYDEIHSLILKETINKDFNILKIRDSEFDQSDVKMQLKAMKLYEKILPLFNLYFQNSKKKIHILLRRYDDRVIDEIKFYKKIFKSNCVFQRANHWKKSYKILDKYENVIFFRSSMGHESISRGKKVAIISPKIIDSNHWFGWPAPNENKYNFFIIKRPSYDEIKRVLNNVKNCSQINWKKKYFSILKDHLYLNTNNTKLKKIILKLL